MIQVTYLEKDRFFKTKWRLQLDCSEDRERLCREMHPEPKAMGGFQCGPRSPPRGQASVMGRFPSFWPPAPGGPSWEHAAKVFYKAIYAFLSHWPILNLDRFNSSGSCCPLPLFHNTELKTRGGPHTGHGLGLGPLPSGRGADLLQPRALS